MLPNKQLHFLIFLFSLLSSYSLKAQLPGECPNLFFNQGCINGLTPDGTPCSLPLNTTADFLNFINDARAGGMGNAAIAVSPDVNAMQYNASKLVMHEKPASVAVNYGQFISDFRSGGDYFNYFSIAAYDRINEKQSIGIDWRFASSQFFNPILSTVTFDEDLHYTEYQIAVAYSRLINSKFSIGITPKLIRSRSDFSFFSAAVTENTNLAFDFSSTYRNKACLFDGSTDLTIGLALSNLGPKLKYESNTHESFLPANIGLGIALDTRLSDLSRLAFTLDVNKLMVPTPEIFEDELGLPYLPYKTQSSLGGMLRSFSDAPGGFSEEWSELIFSFGFECWIRPKVVIRAGYHKEDIDKGDQQYYTFGAGTHLGPVTVNLAATFNKGTSSLTVANQYNFFMASVIYDIKSQKLF